MRVHSTRQPKKTHRLPHGQGAFYYREKDGRWVGTFEAGTSPQGTRRRVVVTSAREDDAWAKLKDARKKYAADGPTPYGLKPRQTVMGWSKEWAKAREGQVRAKTLASDNSNLKQWIIPQIGNVRLEDLTAAHMRKVGEAPRKEGRSLSTANSAQRTLNKMLRAALADGYKVPERIFAAPKSSRGSSERTRMSKTDVMKVFREAYLAHADAVRLFLAVLYGGRQNEILGLTWDRIHIDKVVKPGQVIVGRIELTYQVQQLPYADRAAGTFVVKDGDEVIHLVDAWHLVPTKTEAGARVLPLIAPIAAELEEWRKHCPTGDLNPHNLVFPRITGMTRYLGYPRNPKQDRADWVQAQKAAGVMKRRPDPNIDGDAGEYFVLHEARHSMISMLADAGTPKHIIEMLVGQTQLVDSYVHGDMELAGNAVNNVLAPLLPSAR